MAHDVFISYTREDKPIADAACAALEFNGIRCWIAPRDVLPGREWGAAIISAIKTSKVMVLIFSSNANQSAQIKREVNHAIETGISVLTFRIEDVDPAGALEYYLDVMHWLDAIEPPLEKQLRRLSENVKQLLGEPAPPTPPPLPPSSVKWWLPVGAGLLAAVLIISVWAYVRNDRLAVSTTNTTPSPRLDTPTPGSQPGSSPSPIVNVNAASNPVAVVTPTGVPTQPSASPTAPPSDDTDRSMSEAATVLGNPSANEIERVRAISVLEPLAKTRLDRHLLMVKILTSYIRHNAVWQGGTNRPAKPAPEDIQAAITVLGRRRWSYQNGEGNERLDFTGLDLRGVIFRIEGMRANFNGVRLRGAHLDEAILKDADFRCANLSGAFMKEVDVDKTDFDGADLSNLKETNEARMGVAWNRGRERCAH